MKSVIVMPAYNEDKRIQAVLAEINMPVIVVDDGSKDNTGELLKGSHALVLKHKVNLGKGAALKTGCEAAFALGYDVVVMMDADGQHKVSDLPKLLSVLVSGKYDIVFGSRNLKANMPLVRLLGNRLASGLISGLFKIYVSDLICGYRAFTKKAYRKIYWQSRGYGVETEMVIRTGRSGLRYCEVPVETVYYDKFKGVTMLDAIGILGNVLKWRIFK